MLPQSLGSYDLSRPCYLARHLCHRWIFLAWDATAFPRLMRLYWLAMQQRIDSVLAQEWPEWQRTVAIP
jgi:hypothetical protein